MEKIEKPKKPKTAKFTSTALIIIAILIFGLGYYFYVKPAADKAAELNSQDILTLEVKLGELQTRLFTAKKLAKSYENPSDETIIMLNEALPSGPREVDLFINLTNLIEQSGLTVRGIEVFLPEEKEIPLALQQLVETTSAQVKEIKIKATMEGMSYIKLKRFIQGVETNSRLLKMDELVFNPTSLSYSANLTAYFLEN